MKKYINKTFITISFSLTILVGCGSQKVLEKPISTFDSPNFGDNNKNGSKSYYSDNLKNNYPVDFKYTKNEEKALEKWKNKTFDDMFNDAIRGDAAGLYMLGMVYLIGQDGVPINYSMANKYFAASASLGFAPAIEQMFYMYLEEKGNPYLATAYLNLLTASGHNEFTLSYHDLRTKFSNLGGGLLAERIELIAAEKMQKINEIKEEHRKERNKEDFVFDLLSGTKSLTINDDQFDLDYWYKTFLENQPQGT